MDFVVCGSLLVSKLSSWSGGCGDAGRLFRTLGELLAYYRSFQYHHGFHMALIAIASIELVIKI